VSSGSQKKVEDGKEPAPGRGASAAVSPNVSGQRAGQATPSMAQYLEIKAANPDSLLWYRMGDFYELFFEDAEVASKALGIVLTKRGKHLGEDIPMCGVPVHKADDYLQRLIGHGYRVAVCEQLEDPAEARKRGSKAVVHRDVVRLVTPGTLTEEALLDADRRNYLTAIFLVASNDHKDSDSLTSTARQLALASVDISTGEFEIGEVCGADLPGELVRLSPGEVLAADEVFADGPFRQWVSISGAAATPVPASSFDSLSGEHQLKTHLGVSDLAGFGRVTRPMLAAVGALLRYIDLTQLGKAPMLRPPKIVGRDKALLIDASSRASLELVRSTTGQRKGSLLAAMDRTVTGPGARELAARLANPLTDPVAIDRRLDDVTFLVDEERVRQSLRKALSGAPDVARAMSRLAFGRGGPRDLAAIRDGLATATAIASLLGEAADAIGPPANLAAIVDRLSSINDDLVSSLECALVESPPHLKRDGGFVARGYSPALDDARALRDDSRKVMARLEKKYADTTGVKTLKVRHNNVIGYFVEVSQAQSQVMMEPPHNSDFHHRQTMANAMRFTTNELAETEGKIASAADRALQLEQDIFSDLTKAVLASEAEISDAASALAEIDHIAGLAELAQEQNYVRPVLEDSDAFDITGGRHPVVEQALRAAKESGFIENDCCLGASRPRPTGFDEGDPARLWLVTGPNMAGKSTFLRQNALIVVMAQMGSYVPAEKAIIGVVDRLFSRVGAADDLARGHSTFMVEMIETASILNQATARSLVILDEIGRGTATFDGLSIAWACVEHLHDSLKCRTLFATHYHELTTLADRLDSVANVTIAVKEWRDEIVFLHKVTAGAADRSYGVQVAKLAGLPDVVVQRAREVLEKLEEGRGPGTSPVAALVDLPLFATTMQASHEDKETALDPLTARLDAINVDELTPRAALDLLYDLKSLRQGRGND
jgi:DNA mismatch repair protein MutS